MKKKESMSISQNMTYYIMGMMFYLLCQWLITILVVRLSGYENAGYLALATSITNVCHSIGSYNIRTYMVTDINNKYKTGIYVCARFITTFLSIICCLIFVFYSNYGIVQKVCISGYMLFRCSEIIVDLYGGIQQKKWRMDILAMSYFLRGIITVLSFAIILYMTDELFLSVLGMAIGSFTVIVFYDIPHTKKIDLIDPCFDIKRIVKLLLECSPLVITAILINSIATIPRFYLENIYSSVLLGIYASVATPTVIVQVICNFAFTPIAQLFAQYYQDKDIKKFKNLILKCVIAVIVMSIIFIFGAMIFGEFGLKILYGENIAEYSYLLVAIIITTILTAIVWFFNTLLTTIRCLRGILIGNTIAFIICIGITKAFILKYEMMGATYSLMISLSVDIVILCISFIYKVNKNYKK